MIETRPSDLIAEGHLAGGLVLGLGVGLAVGIVTRRTRAPVPRASVAGAVLTSLLAASAAYVCTPDTEFALGVLGAVLGAGGVAVLLGLAWWWPSVVATGALVATAIHDGRGRASAVVGTLAVTAIHHAGQVQLRRGARFVLVVPVVGAAVAVASRVAGLASTAERALAVATITVAAAGAALAFLARTHPPPAGAGDDDGGTT